jgi:phage terminase large subunit-like protein
VVGAASRDQAAILFDLARGYAQHPEIASLVETTRREIRTDRGWLKVIAADGPKQHGLILDLAIVDELHAHGRRDLYDALRTAMLKRPGARMVTISTAGAVIDTPLGELRERALKLPSVVREGPLTRAQGEHLAPLEWALEPEADLDDMEAVKRCNPASWITEEGLAEQRGAVHELAFARFHCDRWTGGEAPCVLPEEWDACGDSPEIPAGAEVVVGVDASIRHDTTAAVVCAGSVTSTTPNGASGSRRKDTRSRWLRSKPSSATWPTTSRCWRSSTTRTTSGTPASGSRTRACRCSSGSTAGWLRPPAPLHEIVVHKRLRHGGDETARRHAIAAEVK